MVHAFHRKQDLERKSTEPKLDYGAPKSAHKRFRDLTKKLEKAEQKLRYKQNLLEGYPMPEKELEKIVLQKVQVT